MNLKKCNKKIPITFLFEVRFDGDMYWDMETEDKERLEELARYSHSYLDTVYYVFYLADINKVRSVLSKYDIRLTFPKRAELKKYGLSYSGLSMEIERQGDSFLIRQYFPDGRVESHVVPKDRVWRVYYILKKFGEPVEPARLWEAICKDFRITRFFDRSGRFHKNSFFGARRTYFDFYYFPIRVLEHLGKVKYGKKLEAIE